MAHPLQAASVRRKIIYIGAIIALFTVSLFWRGKFGVPFGNPDREVAASPNSVSRVADRLARTSIASQAAQLELRELDQGDPEIAGAAARLALIGSRGLAITGLWRAAIEKQKRGEYHEFEVLVRTVTRLQPNFITPWIFQAWNISYNVSVENDKLGDMFFYIARGIELLAEGDRINSKIYKTTDGEIRKLGSPDMRHQIGFYYQNKFGVSDKVQTLRCLMQLAATQPGQRDPKALRRGDGQIVSDEFRRFCEKNPQLVRRLYTELGATRPEDIVQFLDDNYKVPTRWKLTGELKDDAEQFPIFPPRYDEGPDEYDPKSKDTDDTFDGFMAARAWFGYAMTVIPPPKKDPQTGQPMPWASPVAGEYDEFKYRMPRSPAYILFRQQYPRAQTYLAERLGKEGWFDDKSSWNPDERNSGSNLWLKKSDGDPDVLLKTPTHSREEWSRAYRYWARHGAENALVLDDPTRLNYQRMASRVPGNPGSLPQPGEFTPERMQAYGLTQYDIDAKRSLIYYDQNRSMTNFPYFLGSSTAEQDPLTVEARRVLFEAEQARKSAANSKAIRDYVRGLSIWREVLAKYPEFHRPDRSDKTEEDTYEYELELANLLREDGSVRRRAEREGVVMGALVPSAIALSASDILALTAEDEVGARIAALDPRVQEAGRRRAEKGMFAAHHASLAFAGVALADSPGMAEALREGLSARTVHEEMAWMKRYIREPVRDANGNYVPNEMDLWVRDGPREIVRARLGLTRAPEASGQAVDPSATTEPMDASGGP